MKVTLPQRKLIQLKQVSVDENLANPGHGLVVAHAYYSKSPTDESVLSNNSAQ